MAEREVEYNPVFSLLGALWAERLNAFDAAFEAALGASLFL